MACAVPPFDSVGGRMRFLRCEAAAMRPAAGFSRRLLRWGASALLLALLTASDARAQLEVLLRGVEPALPREGVCAVYRFESEEPDGRKQSEFSACVEQVPGKG